jgi:hypothetical protein
MKPTDKTQSDTQRLRLPGFLNENDIGLGDVIKRATSYIGMTPCGGCESRAAALNRLLVFSASPRNTNTPS